MYNLLAIAVDCVHVVVIIFMLGGIVITNTKNKILIRVKIFHDYFCVLVLILQIIYGLKCPLVVLSDYLRYLDNPNYKIFYQPFTEKLFMKLFGISISSNLILLVILLLAVLGIAHLLTIKKIKRL